MSGSPGNKAADPGADGDSGDSGDGDAGIGDGDAGIGARDPVRRAHPTARQGARA